MGHQAEEGNKMPAEEGSESEEQLSGSQLWV